MSCNSLTNHASDFAKINGTNAIMNPLINLDAFQRFLSNPEDEVFGGSYFERAKFFFLISDSDLDEETFGEDLADKFNFIKNVYKHFLLLAGKNENAAIVFNNTYPKQFSDEHLIRRFYEESAKNEIMEFYYEFMDKTTNICKSVNEILQNFSVSKENDVYLISRKFDDSDKAMDEKISRTKDEITKFTSYIRDLQRNSQEKDAFLEEQMASANQLRDILWKTQHSRGINCSEFDEELRNQEYFKPVIEIDNPLDHFKNSGRNVEVYRKYFPRMEMTFENMDMDFVKANKHILDNFSLHEKTLSETNRLINELFQK